MNTKIILTKRDVVILLICLMVLLLNTGMVGSRGRKHARFVFCQNNLRVLQETQIQFWQDNNGKMVGYSYNLWVDDLEPYAGQYAERIRLCPEADGISDWGSWGNVYEPWNYAFSNVWGSYVFNGYFYNPSGLWIEVPAEFFFTSTYNVKYPAETPVFADGSWIDTWPTNEDSVPDWDPIVPHYTDWNHMMGRLWLDRHDLRDNIAFVDGHVEPVMLRDLWTLRWHVGSEPNYDVVMPW